MTSFDEKSIQWNLYPRKVLTNKLASLIATTIFFYRGRGTSSTCSASSTYSACNQKAKNHGTRFNNPDRLFCSVHPWTWTLHRAAAKLSTCWRFVNQAYYRYVEATTKSPANLKNMAIVFMTACGRGHIDRKYYSPKIGFRWMCTSCNTLVETHSSKTIFEK